MVSAITGEEMDSGDWERGEPNNWGTGKECVIYNSDTGLINDCSELAEFCPICKVKSNVKFQLSGVCKHASVDSIYILQPRGELVGYRQSRMAWSEV